MPPFLSVSLLAMCLFCATFAVNLQAPLYDVYAAHSGVGAAAVTVGFAAYVAGLMPTLVLLGGLSDRVGRRRPISLALVLGGFATALLVAAPNWESLVFARCLLGVSTGLATTAGTAYMTEILGCRRAKLAALTVASATSLGFGGGALTTGVSIGLQGATTAPISYWVLFFAVPVLAVLAFCLPRVDHPTQVSLLRLPVFLPGSWIFGVGLAIAWSATGMTIAVVPLQLAQNDLGGWTGLVVFLAIFVGFLCQPLARQMTNEQSLKLGFLLVPLGFLVLMTGVWLEALVWVLMGTCITSAASYGFTYLAGIAEVSERAGEGRARATAGLFVYAYFGFSVPVVLSGIMADAWGLLTSLLVFFVGQIVATSAALFFWKTKFSQVVSLQTMSD